MYCSNGELEHVAKKRRQWCIKASQEAKKTHNSIRIQIERINVQPNPGLKLIRMTRGDPTLYGNFPPPSRAVEAVLRQLAEESLSHGKGPPCGEGQAWPVVCRLVSWNQLSNPLQVS